MRKGPPHLFPAKRFAEDSEWGRYQKLLEVLPDERLLETLGSMIDGRRKSRRGAKKLYTPRSCWSVMLAQIVFRHKYVTETLAEFRRHSDLREAAGILFVSSVPTSWARSRFVSQLAEHRHRLVEMLDELVLELRAGLPGFGDHLGIDSTKLHTHARGTRDPAESADPEASWGIKTRKYEDKEGKTRESVTKWFGYKLHLLIDTVYERPLSFRVTTAASADNEEVLELVTQAAKNLETAESRPASGPPSQKDSPPEQGVEEREGNPLPETAKQSRTARLWHAFEDSILTADNAYDDEEGVYQPLYEDFGIRAVIPLREIMDADLKITVYDRDRVTRVRNDQTGEWQDLKFLGFDKTRQALLYGCPCDGRGPCPFYQAQCHKSRGGKGPKFRVYLSENHRYYTAVARSTKKWEREYRRRSACERVNGRLKDVVDIDKMGLRGLAKAELRGGLGALVLVAHAVACLRAGEAENIRRLKSA